jgi:CheY-like chemotaxis protein
MENLNRPEGSAKTENIGSLDENIAEFNAESMIKDIFCGFYWIRASGVPFFKWFSTKYFNMKWNQEDLFFSGFFSALNSSGEVFFDGNILHYVEFEEYKIYSGKIRSDDIFVLITTKSAPDSLANRLLHNMLHHYMDSDVAHQIEQDGGDVENTFLNFLKEITNEVNKSGNGSILKKRITSKPFKSKQPFNPLQFSEKQEFQRRIVELELKLNALSMMSRSIGHNLNNVLSAILGNISLAQMDSPMGTEQSECLEEAEYSCKRVRSLTHQLLTIAKNLSRNQSQNQVEIQKSSEKKEIIKGSGRILIMDDEEIIRSTTKKMLTRIGYEVDVAENLEISLLKYQESMQENRKYDAVILDLSELGELGEFGALIWLKLDPNINAIVSSGFAQDPIFDQYLYHGFRGVLRKPYDIRRLSQVLHEVISKP